MTKFIKRLKRARLEHLNEKVWANNANLKEEAEYASLRKEMSNEGIEVRINISKVEAVS